jgi:dTDP-4-dehydrorhamnose 3,5-epimerase
MNIVKTMLDGVLIIEPNIYTDNRGWFFESWSKSKFCANIEFVQDNHSFSAKKGTLRGLHFQKRPNAQSKLMRCTMGKIFDVVVDIRKDSSTYCHWIGVELSSSNFKQLFVPKGFAHGFLTLTNNTEIQYKVDCFYAPESDRCIRWNDPRISVKWNINAPILSETDRKAPLLKDIDNDFRRGFL